MANIIHIYEKFPIYVSSATASESIGYSALSPKLEPGLYHDDLNKTFITDSNDPGKIATTEAVSDYFHKVIDNGHKLTFTQVGDLPDDPYYGEIISGYTYDDNVLNIKYKTLLPTSSRFSANESTSSGVTDLILSYDNTEIEAGDGKLQGGRYSESAAMEFTDEYVQNPAKFWAAEFIPGEMIDGDNRITFKHDLCTYGVALDIYCENVLLKKSEYTAYVNKMNSVDINFTKAIASTRSFNMSGIWKIVVMGDRRAEYNNSILKYVGRLDVASVENTGDRSFNDLITNSNLQPIKFATIPFNGDYPYFTAESQGLVKLTILSNGTPVVIEYFLKKNDIIIVTGKTAGSGINYYTVQINDFSFAPTNYTSAMTWFTREDLVQNAFIYKHGINKSVYNLVSIVDDTGTIVDPSEYEVLNVAPDVSVVKFLNSNLPGVWRMTVFNDRFISDTFTHTYKLETTNSFSLNIENTGEIWPVVCAIYNSSEQLVDISSALLSGPNINGDLSGMAIDDNYRVLCFKTTVAPVKLQNTNSVDPGFLSGVRRYIHIISGASIINCVHNFGPANIAHVDVYDENWNIIIPTSIGAYNISTVQIHIGSPGTYYVILTPDDETDTYSTHLTEISAGSGEYELNIPSAVPTPRISITDWKITVWENTSSGVPTRYVIIPSSINQMSDTKVVIKFSGVTPPLLPTNGLWAAVTKVNTSGRFYNGVVNNSIVTHNLNATTIGVQFFYDSEVAIVPYRISSSNTLEVDTTGFDFSGNRLWVYVYKVSNALTDNESISGLEFKLFDYSEISSGVDFEHGLNSVCLIINVYDYKRHKIIPERIQIVNHNKIHVKIPKNIKGSGIYTIVVLSYGSATGSPNLLKSEVFNYSSSSPNPLLITHGCGCSNLSVGLIDLTTFEYIEPGFEMHNLNEMKLEMPIQESNYNSYLYTVAHNGFAPPGVQFELFNRGPSSYAVSGIVNSYGSNPINSVVNPFNNHACIIESFCVYNGPYFFGGGKFWPSETITGKSEIKFDMQTFPSAQTGNNCLIITKAYDAGDFTKTFIGWSSESIPICANMHNYLDDFEYSDAIEQQVMSEWSYDIATAKIDTRQFNDIASSADVTVGLWPKNKSFFGEADFSENIHIAYVDHDTHPSVFNYDDCGPWNQIKYSNDIVFKQYAMFQKPEHIKCYAERLPLIYDEDNNKFSPFYLRVYYDKLIASTQEIQPVFPTSVGLVQNINTKSILNIQYLDGEWSSHVDYGSSPIETIFREISSTVFSVEYKNKLFVGDKDNPIKIYLNQPGVIVLYMGMKNPISGILKPSNNLNNPCFKLKISRRILT